MDTQTPSTQAPPPWLNATPPEDSESAQPAPAALPPDAPPLAPGQGVDPAFLDPVGAGILEEMNGQQYGTVPQMALTGAEGVAKGVLGPVATLGERILSNAGVPGISPEEQIGREEANPWAHGLGETAGFAGSLLTGVGEAKLLGQAGEAALPIAQALGLGGTGTFSKIGSSVVKGAVENGLFQAGDEASRLIQGRPDNLVETAIPNMGLSAAIGGAFGLGAGGVSSLWRSTAGTKAGALLNAVSERLGGIEGASGNALHEVVSKTGMEIAPEVQAGLSQDPAVQEMFNTLNQSDTTNSGKEFQKTLGDFKAQTGNAVAESLGRTPDAIPDTWDKYSSGKTIGETLASEFGEKIEPLSQKYEEIAHKYADVNLEPSIAEKGPELTPQIAKAETEVADLTKQVSEYGRPPEEQLKLSESLLQAENTLKDLKTQAQTPGTVDMLQKKIADLATGERWVLSPSSDIMGEVNRVMKELPNMKSLGDLSGYIKLVKTNGPLNRVGGMIKGLLRDTESELMGAHVGLDQGEQALNEYRQLQKNWSQVAGIKDALDERLHIQGSTSGYAKRLKTMAATDGESVFSKLSGKDDAHLLGLLQENFPRTADALREAHLDQILSHAKVGDQIQPGKVLASLDKLSPQLHSFLVPEEAATRLDAIGQVLEKLKDSNYNYSNTARTMDKLMQHVPGSAVGLASMVIGHNPAISLMLGGLTKYISKDAPDAVRLALLKWLGSSQPIEAGAFKSMVDLIHSGIQGQTMIQKASRAFISGAGKVIPEHLMPSEDQIKKLDDQVKSTYHPSQLEDVGNGVSYYMPDHGIATTALMAHTVSTLNALRPPMTQSSPLDTPLKPSGLKQTEYERALGIAEQPLMIMHYADQGMLTNQDVALAKTLYPQFVSQLQSHLSDHLSDHLGKGNEITREKQIALSKLLGQPLISSLQPDRLAQNQAVFAQAEARALQNQGGGMAKPSQKGMGKLTLADRTGLSNSNAKDQA